MMKNLIVKSMMAGLLLMPAIADAQRDSVYLTGNGNSSVRGRVTGSSVFKVTVETDDGKKEVPCSQIRKIAFGNEPRGLGRARDHFDSQRYDDCLDVIKTLDNLPDSKLIRQEVSFLEAYSSGKKALRGDAAMSVATAEQTLSKFVRENNDSYRYVPALDLYAQVLMANGKTNQAQKQFSKLTKSRWPKFESRGNFFEGETRIHQQDLAGAKASFQKLLNSKGTDLDTEKFKSLAQCQLAKLAGLGGDTDAAVQQLEKIIQEASSDDTQLFAYAYNALGTCYWKANKLKKACRAFLHTELLFSSESDSHAEALYYLAKIWPELKETERANRARSLLTSRYRNTIWASKL